jgi:hypothetical protein
MDPGEQAGVLIGVGIGAMICTVFGGVWIGLGLQAAGAFPWWMASAFALCCLGLYTGSLFLIRRGRKLRRLMRTPAGWPAVMRNGFIWTVVAEVIGVVAVIWVCNALRRYDWITPGIALVVGLHFLPLGKFFRMPIYYATGLAIVAWCVASVVLFHGNQMDIAAAIGTGLVLWATAARGLIRSRTVLAAIPTAAPAVPPETSS